MDDEIELEDYFKSGVQNADVQAFFEEIQRFNQHMERYFSKPFGWVQRILNIVQAHQILSAGCLCATITAVLSATCIGVGVGVGVGVGCSQN